MLFWLLACTTETPQDHTPAPGTPEAPSDDTGAPLVDTGEMEDTAGVEPVLKEWYLDCGSGDDANDGRGPETPLGSLAAINALVLQPGDAVYLARGSTCVGALRPQGTATAAEPITIGAYGDGARPHIVAKGHDAALRLVDQGGFEVEDLELSGSAPHGVYVLSTKGTIEHLRFSDLHIHDVYAGAMTSKLTGLFVATVLGTGRYSDMAIDGIEAHDTDQWAGIIVYGAQYGTSVDKSDTVLVANSTVHDVYGDGIVLYGARDAVIETSVVWRVGLEPTQTVGTPNGIWTWYCDRCVVQHNEGYEIRSPGVDGGVFDIDWATTDNVVQYNYGHDAQAYCVSVFGAEGHTTVNAVVRGNLCVDNGTIEPQHGAIYLMTWSGGAIDGVRIHDNTIVHRTGTSWPVLKEGATTYTGSRERFFRNNIIVTDSDWMVVMAQGSMALDHNLWSTTADNAWFNIGASWLDGVKALSRQGLGRGSIQSDPLFAGGSSVDAWQLSPSSPAIDAGVAVDDSAIISGSQCDFWGAAVGDTPDIGAHEHGATEPCP